ncbi:hypothetical protein MSTO_05270 [Mycobacterium stomatepiae]|uniref:Uncharacterized protein n=1 Tax=Mycobacterium stomatepiae TaxID=470076 RepID=A0A7I7Q2M7_9MYCO|nr:hypothetical protein MSTO_05270 [Mycobacterium stomatepiae]
MEVGRQHAGDRVVGRTVNRSLPDIDCQLPIGTDFDKRSLATSGLDLHDDGVGHAAKGYRPDLPIAQWAKGRRTRQDGRAVSDWQ